MISSANGQCVAEQCTHQGHPVGELAGIGGHRAVRIVQPLEQPWRGTAPQLLDERAADVHVFFSGLDRVVHGT